MKPGYTSIFKTFLIIIATIAVYIFIITSVAADGETSQRRMFVMHCGPAKPLQKVIEEKYEENQIWYGMIAKGYLNDALALYQNKTTTEWTIVLYLSNGIACIPFTGDDGQIVKQYHGAKY